MKKTEESVMEFRLQLNSQSYDYTFIVLLPESFVKLLLRSSLDSHTFLFQTYIYIYIYLNLDQNQRFCIISTEMTDKDRQTDRPMDTDWKPT